MRVVFLTKRPKDKTNSQENHDQIIEKSLSYKRLKFNYSIVLNNKAIIGIVSNG